MADQPYGKCVLKFEGTYGGDDGRHTYEFLCVNEEPHWHVPGVFNSGWAAMCVSEFWGGDCSYIVDQWRANLLDGMRDLLKLKETASD